MNEINDGGPAFPVPDSEAANLGYHGISTRDWFAGKALLICVKDHDRGYDEWAREAYALADAMLAAREAKP